jgi:hypothetical protein
MAVKFTNNAATTLAAGINSSVTSIAVTDGSVFPTITGSDHFYVTFDDTTNKEIVKVTARSGNTLTVVRGHDNTTARAFSSGDKAELRIVAALLEDVKTDVSSTLTVDTFTGDGSATAFTLSTAPASEDNLIVFIEGVYQNPGDFVLSSGTTLTFDVAPANSRKIIAYHVAALVSGNNLNNDQFTCNGSTTAFTLSLSPIHENNTQVFLDGVYQQKTDYAVSGTTLTMDAAPANGAILEVMTFTQTDVNTLPANFVSGLTEVTAVGADHFMIFDATDSALKKSLVSDVLESATSISTSADATAITIDSSENVTFTAAVTTGTTLSIGGNNNELRFYEGANYVGFEAPALSADKIWVLPAADGSNGQVIKTDGSGNLSFATVSGTTINNNADNRIITGSGTANTLEGEANLTYDGATLAITNSSTNSFVNIKADNGAFSGIYWSDQQGAAGEVSYDHAANEFKIWSGGVVSGNPHLKIKNTYIDAGEMTAYLQLPSGTSAQRPTGANGMIRYNESESKTEIYQGSAWQSLDTTGYSYAIQYVVVAGGGAGGTGAFGDAAGGAGGGGYRSSVTGESSGRGASAESAITIDAGTQYTVTIGAGGSNAVGGNSVISGSGLTTITSNGGGEGGDRQGSNNKDGGCGGGGAYLYTPAGSGTTGQGYDGGVYSGNPYVPGAAGGGAGSTATGSDNEVGGAGVATSITGSSVTYALGGHGGNTSNGASPVAGGANTGTGGGGYYGSSGNGANGGSGVVMLKVPTASYSGTTTGSPAVTTVGDYKIIRFTSSGSYTG